MTRAPRSRHKKNAKPNHGLLDVASPVERNVLPLANGIETNTPDASIASPPGGERSLADVGGAEPTGSAVGTESAGSVNRVERGSMRIEVTEERAQIGARLRAAREVKGWSSDDVAHRLHVPTSVVADIEAERFDRLGAPIYLRGYLTKYAALVGLPQVVVNRTLESFAEPLLKASTEAAHIVASWERYRVALIGAVITLAVAVPVFTLVANRGVSSPVPQVRSLDESELFERDVAVRSEPLVIPGGAIAPVPATPAGETANPSVPAIELTMNADQTSAAPGDVIALEPAAQNPALQASMAGFSTPAASGVHFVEARFREDSWIEIFGADGRVIEQNLVRGGQSRRYESTGAVVIKIGNVGGVDLSADGNSIDLAPHARANVARLRLFEDTPTP